MLDIPDAFRFAPFYEGQSDRWMPRYLQNEKSIPFFYDMLFIQKPSALNTWPWKGKGDDLSGLWAEEREKIRIAFHQRDLTHAREALIFSAAVFIDRLIWASGGPVHSLDPDLLFSDLRQLPYQPLNMEARLDYILQQPDRYPALIQLEGLQDELTKKLAMHRRKPL